MAELHRRTEGWPAGLYLAALYLREGGPLASAAVSFGGDDRLVSEYMESEFLARISRPATGIPDPDRGAGADVRAAVRGGAGAARIGRATLADLARSNLLLVPLDRRGEWYRYHHLFRDMLLARAEPPDARTDPGAAAPRRRLVPGERLARGGAGALDGGGGRRYGRWPGGRSSWHTSRPAGPGPHRPAVARGGWRIGAGSRDTPWPQSLAALFCALTGRPVEAERWAGAVDRWQDGDPARPDAPSVEAWAAVMRTFLCRRGAEQMRADADDAVLQGSRRKTS